MRVAKLCLFLIEFAVVGFILFMISMSVVVGLLELVFGQLSDGVVTFVMLVLALILSYLTVSIIDRANNFFKKTFTH